MKHFAIVSEGGYTFFHDCPNDMPLLAFSMTQEHAFECMNQYARSVRCGDTLFVSEKFESFHYVAVSDEGDSELSLRRKLQFLRDLVAFYVHCPPDAAGEPLYGKTFAAYRSLTEHRFSAVLDAVEVLSINSGIKTMIETMLGDSLFAARSITHGLLFVGNKLAVNWNRRPVARQRSNVIPALTHGDVLLLMMHSLCSFDCDLGNDVLVSETTLAKLLADKEPQIAREETAAPTATAAAAAAEVEGDLQMQQELSKAEQPQAEGLFKTDSASEDVPAELQSPAAGAGEDGEFERKGSDRRDGKELMRRHSSKRKAASPSNGSAGAAHEDEMSDVTDDYVSCFGDLDGELLSPLPEHREDRCFGTDDILMAQTFLRSISLYNGELSGVWNSESCQSLQEYQKSQGLPTTNQLDSAVMSIITRHMYSDYGTVEGDEGAYHTPSASLRYVSGSHRGSKRMGSSLRKRSTVSLTRKSSQGSFDSASPPPPGVAIQLSSAASLSSSTSSTSPSSVSPPLKGSSSNEGYGEQLEAPSSREPIPSPSVTDTPKTRASVVLQSFGDRPSLICCYKLGDNTVLVLVCSSLTAAAWEDVPEDAVQEIDRSVEHLRNQISEYMSFLETCEKTHVRMMSYLHECPGMIHFLYCDRTHNYTVSPAISSLLAKNGSAEAEIAHLKWLRTCVHRMVEWGVKLLWDGQTFGLIRLTGGSHSVDLQIGYQFWIEDENHEHVMPEVPLKDLRGLLCSVSNFSNGELVRRLFPSVSDKRRNLFTVHEFFSLWLGFIDQEMVHQVSSSLQNKFRFSVMR
eukprot:ANDGO_06353.mRNA.1 putative peptidoglycan binding domain containing protein